MTENGTPKIRGINHITLAVSDLDATASFYRDVLGLTLQTRLDDMEPCCAP